MPVDYSLVPVFTTMAAWAGSRRREVEGELALVTAAIVFQRFSTVLGPTLLALSWGYGGVGLLTALGSLASFFAVLLAVVAYRYRSRLLTLRLSFTSAEARSLALAANPDSMPARGFNFICPGCGSSMANHVANHVKDCLAARGIE